jgi:hypothetical protein
VTTRSEHARYARAELETIAAAMGVDELEQLISVARRLLEQAIAGQERHLMTLEVG